MAEYHQYCPVARASEILADRWTPLIVRELLAGSQHFNDIERGLPGISRSVLAERLRHLEDAGVVERHRGDRANVSAYLLTEAGTELRAVIDQMGAWGVRWAFGEPRPTDLDPVLLLWKVHQRVDRTRLPSSRTVVEFDFRGRAGRRLWLVLEPREVSVCLRPPRFETDLVVRVDVLADRELVRGDDALALVADVDEHLVVVDAHDTAGDDLALLDGGEGGVVVGDDLPVDFEQQAVRTGDDGCLSGGVGSGGGHWTGKGSAIVPA